MNVSIRKQLTVIFIGLMLLLFLSNYLVNTFFLGEFYFVRKQQALEAAYNVLNQNISDIGSMDDSKLHEYEDICNTNSIFSIVTDTEYRRLIWTDTTYMESDYIKKLRGRLNGYMLGFESIDEDAILKKTDNYTIQQKYDSACLLYTSDAADE